MEPDEVEETMEEIREEKALSPYRLLRRMEESDAREEMLSKDLTPVVFDEQARAFKDARSGEFFHADVHSHSSPTHHLGPCDPACRQGFRAHAHRVNRRGER